MEDKSRYYIESLDAAKTPAEFEKRWLEMEGDLELTDTVVIEVAKHRTGKQYKKGAYALNAIWNSRHAL